MFKLSLISFVLCVALVLAKECQHRDYQNGATVCVCSKDHCDDIEVHSVPANEVHSYVTSKQGDRFAFHKIDTKHTEAHPQVTVHVDRSLKYQKIIGFGGAFTDSAGYNIAKLPKELQNRLIEDYFGKRGIEYTVGRINIGGCDFSTRAYSYDDHADDESLSKFALQPEDLDWKIPYLKLAKQVSPHPENVKFFGSPWSAPAWMKTNNELRHGGFLKGRPGEKYYKMFAHYFVKFLEEYKKNNVSIWGLTIENEPGAGFAVGKYPWNSLGFNATLERDFIKLDLGPILEKAGYGKDKLAVMIHDDQLPALKSFSKTVLSDPEAAKYVAGIAFHWYDSAHGKKQDIVDVLNEFKGHFVLATEACEEWKGKSSHVSLGNWATFDRYALDIITDLNYQTAGWVDWNLALDLKGGPNWVGNLVDAPIIVNETSHEYYKQPFFYALGHFSKFISPNSVQLGRKVDSSAKETVEVTVFERPDKVTVLTALNVHDKPVSVQVLDPSTSKNFTVQIKPHSLYSMLWH